MLQEKEDLKVHPALWVCLGRMVHPVCLVLLVRGDSLVSTACLVHREEVSQNPKYEKFVLLY